MCARARGRCVCFGGGCRMPIVEWHNHPCVHAGPSTVQHMCGWPGPISTCCAACMHACRQGVLYGRYVNAADLDPADQACPICQVSANAHACKLPHAWPPAPEQLPSYMRLQRAAWSLHGRAPFSSWPRAGSSWPRAGSEPAALGPGPAVLTQRSLAKERARERRGGAQESVIAAAGSWAHACTLRFAVRYRAEHTGPAAAWLLLQPAALWPPLLPLCRTA